MVGGQNEDRLDVLRATSRALPGPSAEAHGSGAREARPRPGGCERARAARRELAGTTAGTTVGTTIVLRRSKLGARALLGGQQFRYAAESIFLRVGTKGGSPLLRQVCCKFSIHVLAQKGLAPFFAKHSPLRLSEASGRSVITYSYHIAPLVITASYHLSPDGLPPPFRAAVSGEAPT